MKKKEKVVTIRFSAELLDLLEDVRTLARKHNRSLNGEILTVLHDYVVQQKREERSADEH